MVIVDKKEKKRKKGENMGFIVKNLPPKRKQVDQFPFSFYFLGFVISSTSLMHAENPCFENLFLFLKPPACVFIFYFYGNWQLSLLRSPLLSKFYVSSIRKNPSQVQKSIHAYHLKSPIFFKNFLFHVPLSKCDIQ